MSDWIKNTGVAPVIEDDDLVEYITVGGIKGEIRGYLAKDSMRWRRVGGALAIDDIHLYRVIPANQAADETPTPMPDELHRAHARIEELERKVGTLIEQKQTLAGQIADYEEVSSDQKRLVRELDVLLNGDGAAKQASLCDIVAQVAGVARAVGGPVLRYVSMPKPRMPRVGNVVTSAGVDMALGRDKAAIAEVQDGKIVAVDGKPAWLEQVQGSFVSDGTAEFTIPPEEVRVSGYHKKPEGGSALPYDGIEVQHIPTGIKVRCHTGVDLGDCESIALEQLTKLVKRYNESEGDREHMAAKVARRSVWEVTSA